MAHALQVVTCTNAKVKDRMFCQLYWADVAVAVLSFALLNIHTTPK